MVPTKLEARPLGTMLFDSRLNRRTGLLAGSRVLFGRIIVGVDALLQATLEGRVDISGHQLIAPQRWLPISPVMRQQQNCTTASPRAIPNPLEVLDAIIRRANTAQLRLTKIIDWIRDLRRDDRERRHLRKIFGKVLEPERHFLLGLLPRLGHMRERHDAPVTAIGLSSVLTIEIFASLPVAAMSLHRVR